MHNLKLTTLLIVGLLILSSCHTPCDRTPCPPWEKCSAFDIKEDKDLGLNGLAKNAKDEYLTSNLTIVADSTWVREEGTNWHLHAISTVGIGGRSCSPEHETQAVIGLPTGSKVVSANFSDKNGRQFPWMQCGATIVAQLPEHCENFYSYAIMDVLTTQATDRNSLCHPSFSVHAFGPLPDIDPSNNYWWWRSECGTGSDDWKLIQSSWGPPLGDAVINKMDSL